MLKLSLLTICADKDFKTPKECSTTAASSSPHGGYFDIPESEVSREYTDAKRVSG